MPEIQIPSMVITGLQIILAFSGAFFIALWLSLIVWTFRDARSRSRDIFAILLATLMVVVFGPLGLMLYFLLRPPVTLAELYERSLEEEALLQDLEERPRCPGCSRQVDEKWIICPDCHTTLKKICANCQSSLYLSWNICPFCGAQAGVLPYNSHDQHGSSGLGVPVTATQPMAMPAPAVSAPSAPTIGQSAYPPRSDETKPQAPQAGLA
jgi:RNA polymerase subunit RPABC4/transcription elongation factor Spt4